MNDQKLIQFYYHRWGLSSAAFCKEFGVSDLNEFDRFLNHQSEDQKCRDALKVFWEKIQTKNMIRQQDDSDTSSDSGASDQSPKLKSSTTTTPNSLGKGQSMNNLKTGNSSSSSASGGGEKRVRNLLKNYYGASIGEGESHISSDPMNIDGPAFSLQTYFDNIVKTSSLPQLIQKDNEMVSEIRTLDGDMKTLVYENYTKFINATDIIKKMKTNVENMEESMELLSKNMDLITSCSDKINTTLSVRRDKIDQLSGLQKLLQKLQYLTALPSSLKDCLDMQLYGQAVKYYNSNNGILKQYSHIPSFANIQVECDALMKTMKSKLYEKLGLTDSDKATIMESCEILIELLEPVEQVRSKYLDGRKLYLSEILSQFQNRKTINNIIEFISELNKSFLSELVFILTSYKTLFINRLDGSNSVKEKKNSISQLEEFNKELFNRYLALAKVKLSTFKNPKEKIEALEIIYQDVLNMNSNGNAIVEQSSSTNDIINSTANDQISYYFDNLSRLMNSQIHDMNKQLLEKGEDSLQGNYLFELSEKTMQLIVQDLSELFTNLKPFFITTKTGFLTPHYGTIFEKIQVKLQQFFLFLGNIHFLEYLDTITLTSNKEEFGPLFLLSLCNICLLLESRGISQVVQMLQDFVQVVKQSMSASQIQQNDLNSFQALNQPDLSKRLRETSQKILSLYTKLTSLKCSKLLLKGLESNLLKLKEPKDARSVIELYLDNLVHSQTEIQKIFNPNVNYTQSSFTSLQTPTNPTNSTNTSSGNTPTLSTRHTRNASSTSKISPNNQNTTTNNNNNQNATTTNSQLFDKKLDIYNPNLIEFNWKSILTCIVKLSLKSYIELLRTKTLGTNGYHQIIIDNQFLKLGLIDILGSQNNQQSGIDSLMDLCETTISERCIDTANIAPSIVKKICDDAIKKRRDAKNLESSQQ